MASSTDDGTNSLFVNDREIPTSYWVGSGDYAFNVGGVTYTITMAPDLNGNYQLIKDDDTEFHFARAYSVQEELINLIYPVGSLYWSVNDVNPSTYFGGSWIKNMEVSGAYAWERV